jgi:hypothetical protein
MLTLVLLATCQGLVNHQIQDQDLPSKEVVVHWVGLATRLGPVRRKLAVTQECVEQGVLAAGHPEL